jgi:uncharacterized protein involved in response to NO
MRDRRWRAARLLESPHRLGFFAAACVLAASALWWLAWMMARHVFGAAWPWAVPPALSHGLLFGYGFMPLFFTGFLFTAGPKWLGLPPVDAHDLLRPVVATLAGWAMFVVGVHVHVLVAAFALVVVALAWLGLMHRLAALLRISPRADRTHLRVILVAGRLGGAALLGCAAFLAGREDAARAALQLGLWGFMAPVFVAAVHRMLPVFEEDAVPPLAALQPKWLLWTLIALCLLQWPFALADLWWWPQPTAWRVAQFAVDGFGAVLVLAFVARWAARQGPGLRLIVMLQLGVAWLGLALALAALSQLLLWASDGTIALGLASQHAFSMGFLGTVMLAMTTRVASGQAGHRIAADRWAWSLFLLLQLAVLLRLAAAWWAAVGPALLAASALAWALAMLGWAARHVPGFGRPTLPAGRR